MKPVSVAWLSAFCMLTLALNTSCAKASAADLVPDGPPLATPAPPPREIVPVEGVASAPPAETPAPAAAAAGTPPPRPSARPESSPAPAAAPPASTPPASTPPARETREVRAVPSAAAAAEERKVRALMTRAADDLKRVNYQRLSAEGRAQYDQSKRFSEEADQALRDRNFVYAMTLADKAATIAAELAGRR